VPERVPDCVLECVCVLVRVRDWLFVCVDESEPVGDWEGVSLCDAELDWEGVAEVEADPDCDGEPDWLLVDSCESVAVCVLEWVWVGVRVRVCVRVCVDVRACVPDCEGDFVDVFVATCVGVTACKHADTRERQMQKSKRKSGPHQASDTHLGTGQGYIQDSLAAGIYSRHTWEPVKEAVCVTEAVCDDEDVTA
jgi:hypothetical protein